MQRIITLGFVAFLCISIGPIVTLAHSSNLTKVSSQKRELGKQNKTIAKQNRVFKKGKNVSKQKRVHQSIERAIQKASQIHGFSPKLIRALIQAESGGGVRGVYAVSKKNAKGLTQLLPGTAKEMGVRDPFNIEQNILGGSGYLKKLLNKFDSLFLGLVAYNWGPHNTHRALLGKKRIPISVRRYASKIVKASRGA